MTTKSPLHLMASTTPTDYWNDSCALSELEYAVSHGAVGATTNPSIVLYVLKKEMARWRERIPEMIREDPAAGEVELTWRLVEEMARGGAALLQHIFEGERGLKGRLSAQTNPQLYRDAGAMTTHALRLASIAPNMQVKLPATAAGVRAVEEATFQGVSVNTTVCFSVAQAVACAEAIERGLGRRGAAGLPTGEMAPVCTIMVGRIEDWLDVLVKRDGVAVTPGAVPWAGVAVFKRAYRIFQERGFRARLLAAAYRHDLHWTELIGADGVLTMTWDWQVRFNASAHAVTPRIDAPVDPGALAELCARFPDFVRAFEPDGLAVEEFDTFGPTVRTLRGFISAYHDLQAVVRDFMLPNPDVT
ncbi:MAG: transaldolase family protein [Pseudomonadota bacterium]